MRFRKPGWRVLLLAGLALPGAAVQAQEVGLAGIMGSKALLMINGAPPRAVQAGATIDGIKLLSVQSDQVVVEIAGRKRPLRVGQHAVGLASDGAGKVILTADGQGHFVTTGTVNGNSVRFLVDTGASMISLGQAMRAGWGWIRARGGRVFRKRPMVRPRSVSLNSIRCVLAVSCCTRWMRRFTRTTCRLRCWA